VSQLFTVKSFVPRPVASCHRYKKKGFPWLPFGKGSANIDITGCSMNLMLTLAEDAAGHLQLASSQVRYHAIQCPANGKSCGTISEQSVVSVE
jgi:hypothetical protein